MNPTRMLLPLLLIGTALACTTASQLEERQMGLHPKLNNSAYIEDGDLLAVIVDTRIARLRDARPGSPS